MLHVMVDYLHWDEKNISDFSDSNIKALYNEGYVFTRLGKGVMHQTRSVRVDLAKFELSSENRRILRKTDLLHVTCYMLHDFNYDWTIGKMGKDFYETKFGEKTFSANKVKELMTDEKKSNFNKVMMYSGEGNVVVGYCIALETNDLLHYAYPFYNLKSEILNLGMGMMLRAIIWAKENGKRHIYLGSAQRPSDTYKMQFAGVEWFAGKGWKNDVDSLKKILDKNVS